MFDRITSGFSCFMLLCILLFSCRNSPGEEQSAPPEQSLLIFTKTEGFRHSSIPDGVAAIQQLAAGENIQTVHTEDARYFHPDSLALFDVVIFLNTTGDILNSRQQQYFEQFMQAGGAFMGIHSAADTEYGWPWYGKMVGAWFESHPKVQEATLKVTNSSHPATSFLSSEWVRTDEWYNFKEISNDIQVLIQLDETSYSGGKNGAFHPASWYHELEGGRVFYTVLGHTPESYSEKRYLAHLKGGLEYLLSTQE